MPRAPTRGPPWTGVLLATDPQLGEIGTPNGRVRSLQIVGVDDAALALAEQVGEAAVIEPAPPGPADDDGRRPLPLPDAQRPPACPPPAPDVPCPMADGEARGPDPAQAPTAPTRLSVVIASPSSHAIAPFWTRALGYNATPDGHLTDPLDRDPPFRITPATDARPLRNRIHVDVVRPPAVVAATHLGEPFGPYGVCHADADGNEVDLVPGDPLTATPETVDWQVVFAAMACYRTASPAQQRDLVTAAATLADDAGFPLRIDVRPGLVVLDTGKDRWEPEVHGLDLDFTDLAARLQAAARELGAVADPTLPRLVQLVIDAADIPAVRAFWAAALDYVPDPCPHATDLVDPRGRGPVLLFQGIDLADTARRRQRNRIHLELTLPADDAAPRLDAALAKGGRLLGEGTGTWHLADPEGNELVLTVQP